MYVLAAYGYEIKPHVRMALLASGHEGRRGTLTLALKKTSISYLDKISQQIKSCVQPCRGRNMWKWFHRHEEVYFKQVWINTVYTCQYIISGLSKDAGMAIECHREEPWWASQQLLEVINGELGLVWEWRRLGGETGEIPFNEFADETEENKRAIPEMWQKVERGFLENWGKTISCWKSGTSLDILAEQIQDKIPHLIDLCVFLFYIKWV